MQESVSMHKSPAPVRHSRMNQARSEEEEKERKDKTIIKLTDLLRQFVIFYGNFLFFFLCKSNTYYLMFVNNCLLSLDILLFTLNNLSIKHQSYQKSRKLDAFEQRIRMSLTFSKIYFCVKKITEVIS